MKRLKSKTSVPTQPWLHSSLPPRNWKLAHQSFVDRELRYCDQGKYLLAFAAPDALMMIETAAYSIHPGIKFGAQEYGGQELASLTYLPFSDRVTADYSAHTPYVVLGSWGDLHASSIKVFDLTKSCQLYIPRFHTTSTPRPSHTLWIKSPAT
jgi:hypothetical protein